MQQTINAKAAHRAAISEPAPPIAMLSEAFFSAGASFIPSPIMHTGKPAFSYSSIYSSLFSGRQPILTSSPARFVNRKAFSCHYSLVYRGGALNDNSVNRNCLSGEDTDNIADFTSSAGTMRS